MARSTPRFAQADRDEGRREDGLTTAEREELNRLRRENRQLKLEREILSNQRGPRPPVA
jgi:transposase